MKLGKMFFTSFQKLFSFSRKSNFRNLFIQILWFHQMPNHKTRDTFYWITGEVNSLLMKYGQFFILKTKQKHQKKFAKTAAWKLVPGLLCLQRIKHNLYWKMTFLNWATYIWYVVAKLSKFVKISTQIRQIPFYRGFFENEKGSGTSFQVIFFIELFDKNFAFVIT